MEKIKFGTTQYDLTPGGYYVTGDQLKLAFVWPEGVAYEEIEASLTGCDRIELLAESGDLLEAIKGYTCVDRLVKRYYCVIGTERVEDGQGEDGETLYTSKDVLGTVMIATLKKPDVRAELDSVKETVEMLVVSGLEV